MILTGLPILAPPRSRAKSRRPLSFSSAFSLIELLVVIAIIAILASLTIPALPSILGSKGVSKGVDLTSGILELARTEAMARRTYVYVSFLNHTNLLGNSELRIGAVSSLDGSTNTSPDNLRPITKVLKVDKILMTDILPSHVQSLVTNATYLSAASAVAFKVGPVDFAATTPGIVFSPNGEILPNSASLTFSPKVDIGLVLTKGTSPQTNDGAIVRYLGGSGTIQVFRP